MDIKVEQFIASCDELITCKFLVAEFKIQKMLQELADTERVCSLVGECLEEFNRDREFSKAFIQDGHGGFVCEMPEEEYKIIALVFCTLVDIDNKKIDFTDFIKRFFGRNDNSFDDFIKTMIIPFRNLIAEAFGYPKIKLGSEEKSEITKEKEEKEEENEEPSDDSDEFLLAQKVAVQILSELQYLKSDYNAEKAAMICRSIVKTANLKDDEVTSSLILALKEFKVKSIKFMVKELTNLFNL